MPIRIGIRREDKNEWERRAPLVPRHVRALVQEGIEVFVQPSTIRIFKDDEYAAAGAVVQEDLSSCRIVFAVKEIPAGFFRETGTYMFFSHTFKGQPYNMPMLAHILSRRASLMDYEKVTGETNQRLIFFGNYAGTAGMFETLHTLGKRVGWEGVKTPFASLKRPLDYLSLEHAKAALSEVGKRIRSEGLPPELSPLVVGFTGYGNVSKGAQEILELLPYETISPQELNHKIKAGSLSNRLLYKVVFYERDMVRPREPGMSFELQDYYAHPEKYEGIFDIYLPNLTVLVNCIYWDARYPRLVTKDWVRKPGRPDQNRS